MIYIYIAIDDCRHFTLHLHHGCCAEAQTGVCFIMVLASWWIFRRPQRCFHRRRRFRLKQEIRRGRVRLEKRKFYTAVQAKIASLDLWWSSNKTKDIFDGRSLQRYTVHAFSFLSKQSSKIHLTHLEMKLQAASISFGTVSAKPFIGNFWPVSICGHLPKIQIMDVWREIVEILRWFPKLLYRNK